VISLQIDEIIGKHTQSGCGSPSPPPVVPERAPPGLPQATLLPTEVPASVEIMPSAHQSSTESGQNAALPVGAEPSEASMSWRAALLGIWGLGAALLLVRLTVQFAAEFCDLLLKLGDRRQLQVIFRSFHCWPVSVRINAR
jgi:hypothetical protein